MTAHRREGRQSAGEMPDARQKRPLKKERPIAKNRGRTKRAPKGTKPGEAEEATPSAQDYNSACVEGDFALQLICARLSSCTGLEQLVGLGARPRSERFRTAVLTVCANVAVTGIAGPAAIVWRRRGPVDAR